MVEQHEDGAVDRFNHCECVRCLSYLGYLRISLYLSLFITNFFTGIVSLSSGFTIRVDEGMGC